MLGEAFGVDAFGWEVVSMGRWLLGQGGTYYGDRICRKSIRTCWCCVSWLPIRVRWTTFSSHHLQSACLFDERGSHDKLSWPGADFTGLNGADPVQQRGFLACAGVGRGLRERARDWAGAMGMCPDAIRGACQASSGAAVVTGRSLADETFDEWECRAGAMGTDTSTYS